MAELEAGLTSAVAPLLGQPIDLQKKIMIWVTKFFPQIYYVERDVKLPFARWLLAASVTPLFAMVLMFPITLSVYAFYLWRHRADPQMWRKAIRPTFILLYVFFFITSLIGFYGSCRFQVGGNGMIARLNSAVCGPVKAMTA